MKAYYDDGRGIVIYHGRCEHVLPELGQADLLLSDPPYGINYVHGARRGGIYLGTDGIAITGDDDAFDPRFLLAAGRSVILWGANHYGDKLPLSPGWLVWDKRGGVNINDQSDCELAWTNFLRTARLYFRRWNGAVRGGAEQWQGRLHPSQKPVALMAWCIERATLKPSSHILDPYMGTGSTLEAARQLNHRCIGVEIEERYCEAAAVRLSQGLLPLEVIP